ncbi:hypothetical protein BH11PSE1_BH11PSE1_23370 [soil metagenome]
MTIETPPTPSTLVSPPAKSVFAKPMVLAGVAGACVLGLTLGLLARPQLAPDSSAEGSMKPVEQVQIQIDRDEPLPAVTGGKLELLPAGLKAPRIPAPAADAIPVNAVEPRPAPARTASRGPSFDCADTASASEDLVCNDADLAAQDRRLAASWRRALDSGVPAWRLRRQQQRWLDAREDAARNEPEAVADLYDQRIRELDEVGGDDR